MAAIRIQGLQKTYATGVKALKGVDLVIPEGSMTALLGANGAGKTTLIGILTGLVTKTAGTANVFGLDLDKQPEALRACIGVVPQEFNFSIFETVEEIILNQAGYYGVPRKEALVRMEPILRELNLWEKRNTVSRTLSGGMKRRLMIARALVHQPKLLLLDEPSAGVDVELRHEMWTFIKRLHTQGTTIVLTTHYLEEAEQLCDRVVIMRQGEIVRQGAVRELLGGLQQQSFVLTVNHLPSEGGTYAIVKRDTETIEATLQTNQTLRQLLDDLGNQNVDVRDIRPKSNRLEELYLQLSKNV